MTIAGILGHQRRPSNADRKEETIILIAAQRFADDRTEENKYRITFGFALRSLFVRLLAEWDWTSVTAASDSLTNHSNLKWMSFLEPSAVTSCRAAVRERERGKRRALEPAIEMCLSRK